MADRFTVVDAWVGQFPSRSHLDAYLDERYSDDDDEPISDFAADQDVAFYDHDFVECGFQPDPESFDEVIKGHSFYRSYLNELREVYERSGIGAVNSVILVWGEEIPKPRSASRKDVSVKYLGRFACDPNEEEETSIEPPTEVRLLIRGDEQLMLGGESTSSILIGPEGLIVGCAGFEESTPYLDLSGLAGAEGLAASQAKIYRDQFGQWVLQDQGNNGLTAVGGQVLNGERSLPWGGTRISFGSLTFQWDSQADH